MPKINIDYWHRGTRGLRSFLLLEKMAFTRRPICDASRLLGPAERGGRAACGLNEGGPAGGPEVYRKSIKFPLIFYFTKKE